ncbi:MAG: TonB family protein [Bacteroidia bacterium]|nr:TonB family protein [Bacteroidia bacterium]
MKFIYLSIAIGTLLFSAISSGFCFSIDSLKYPTEALEDSFLIVDEMPEFPGGIQAMYKFLSKNVEYPFIAKEKNITGKVLVKFIITSEGNVDRSYVITGVHESIDQAALDVINKMPKWKPGFQRGKPVSVWMTIPIKFILAEGEKLSSFDYYFKYGVNALSKEEWLSAKKYFTKCLNYRSTNPDAYNNRAIAYKQLGKIKKACKDWQKALKYGHPEAQNLLDEHCQEYIK